jgi:Putative prokaryotic signal transducing protein
MSQDDLVVIHAYATEGEAAVARGILESSGIAAMLQADTAGRMRDHLAWSGLGHRVLVREEDADEARKLLAVPQDDDLVVVKRARESQVDLFQEALLSADIFTTIRYDGTHYQLLVNKEDVEAARKVLDELLGSRP